MTPSLLTSCAHRLPSAVERASLSPVLLHWRWWRRGRGRWRRRRHPTTLTLQRHGRHRGRLLRDRWGDRPHPPVGRAGRGRRVEIWRGRDAEDWRGCAVWQIRSQRVGPGPVPDHGRVGHGEAAQGSVVLLVVVVVGRWVRRVAATVMGGCGRGRQRGAGGRTAKHHLAGRGWS